MKLDASSPWSLSRRIPVRGLQSSDAGVPLMLAVGVAAGVFVAVLVALALLDHLMRRFLGPHMVFKTQAMIAALAGVGAAAWFLVRTMLTVAENHAALWVSEERVESVALPAPEAKTLALEVEDIAGSYRRLDLPFDEAALMEFARGVVSGGRSLSMDDWTGSGRPFSRAEYLNLRSQLIDRGLAGWRDAKAKTQGWELSQAGWDVMRQLAGPEPESPGQDAMKRLRGPE